MNHFLVMLDRLAERSGPLPALRLRLFPLEASPATELPAPPPTRLPRADNGAALQAGDAFSASPRIRRAR